MKSSLNLTPAPNLCVLHMASVDIDGNLVMQLREMKGLAAQQALSFFMGPGTQKLGLALLLMGGDTDAQTLPGKQKSSNSQVKQEWECCSTVSFTFNTLCPASNSLERIHYLN